VTAHSGIRGNRDAGVENRGSNIDVVRSEPPLDRAGTALEDPPSTMNEVPGSSEAPRPEGRYANYFEVGHNAFEFILNFGQVYEDSEPANVHTRIVTSPSYVKAFAGTLLESIARYERAFGRIEDAT
jgi:Protein of unknown function (DUF3467)